MFSVLLGLLFRSGIFGPYDNFMINCLRNCQIIFHSEYTILHSYQQYMRIMISPYTFQHLLFSTKKQIMAIIDSDIVDIIIIDSGAISLQL